MEQNNFIFLLSKTYLFEGEIKKMELYKWGKIISIGKNYIVFESNFLGEIIYVANVSEWNVEKNVLKKIYLFRYENEYIKTYYGFKNFNERIIFEDLIGISGVGPKTALNILKEGEKFIFETIASSNINALSKVPQIGIKIANQIVFELKDKYALFSYKSEQKNQIIPLEIKQSLKTLGFTQKQIDYAISNLSPENSIEVMIEKAIKIISNAKFA